MIHRSNCATSQFSCKHPQVSPYHTRIVSIRIFHQKYIFRPFRRMILSHIQWSGNVHDCFPWWSAFLYSLSRISVVVVMLPLFHRGTTQDKLMLLIRNAAIDGRGETLKHWCKTLKAKSYRLFVYGENWMLFRVGSESVGDCSCWFGNFSSRSIFLTVHVGGWKLVKERKKLLINPKKPPKSSEFDFSKRHLCNYLNYFDKQGLFGRL